MQLCWDLEQYAPEDIPDTVVTPMGRFRLGDQRMPSSPPRGHMATFMPPSPAARWYFRSSARAFAASSSAWGLG